MSEEKDGQTPPGDKPGEATTPAPKAAPKAAAKKKAAPRKKAPARKASPAPARSRGASAPGQRSGGGGAAPADPFQTGRRVWPD